MTFERHELVLVPFPFTDRESSITRPALVLSAAAFEASTGQLLLAMVTRAGRSDWPHDMPLEDWQRAGLRDPCLVRMKLFTVTHDLVRRRLGQLTAADARRVLTSLRQHLVLEENRS